MFVNNGPFTAGFVTWCAVSTSSTSPPLASSVSYSNFLRRQWVSNSSAHWYKTQGGKTPVDQNIWKEEQRDLMCFQKRGANDKNKIGVRENMMSTRKYEFAAFSQRVNEANEKTSREIIHGTWLFQTERRWLVDVLFVGLVKETPRVRASLLGCV